MPRRLALACLIAAATLGAGAARALPDFAAVRQAHRPSDLQILDRHGAVLHRLRVDKRVRRGDWVPLPDISPALRTALVYSEDRRFYEHSGVDWQAVAAAAWGQLWHQRTRGASTLTMQLAGLLEDDLRASAGGRSVPQKLGQTVAAQVLERRWRKDQILEAYLNLVPFRGELVGIDALSRTLFAKAPHGLDTREAAVAAALLRGPNAAAAQVARRACGIERALLPGTDCSGLDLFVTGALQRKAWDGSAGLAPHLARRAVAEARRTGADLGTLRALRTSADARVQRLALERLRQQLRELSAQQVEDGAVLVLDNASGAVLAWVGSSGELSQAPEVDAVLAARQPGSTLKPFLYLQAIAERRLTAASLLEDAPTHIPTAGGLYIPRNYDQSFKGWVSLRTALGASLNVPAVRTLVQVTPERFAQQLQQLGLQLAHGAEHYGYSLALGGAEVSLLALTNAYRTLANLGRAGPVHLLAPSTAAPATAPVVDPAAAFIVGDLLADANARVRTFGSDSVLNTRPWSAVKTGTSKDMRDNWAVGFSRRYTVGVWVGNASGAPMHGVSGVSGAAPVWAGLMADLHARSDAAERRAPAAPRGVEHHRVRFGGGLEATRDEWFLPGTAQAEFAIDSIANNETPAAESGKLAIKILRPTPGAVLALDPDIPPAHQQLRLEAGPVAPRDAARLRWWLDGKALARGAQARWMPWPGRHVLRLTLDATVASAQPQVLDELTLEVRGAGLRAAPVVAAPQGRNTR